MTNFQVRPGALYLSAAIAVLATLAPSGRAEGLSLGAVTSSSTTTVATTKSDDVGIGNYSHFPFELTLSVRGGYDDNVTTSNAQQDGSPFTNGSIALAYEFGDQRTELTLGAGLGFTYYWEDVRSAGIDSNDYDFNSYLAFNLLHKANPRLTLGLKTYLTYQTEPDFMLTQGVNRRGGNYFYTNDQATVIYLWAPRFSTATSYNLLALQYDDDDIGFFEDRFQHTFGNEFRFALWPQTLLIAEYRFMLITYDQINGRDSYTHFALGGFDHTFNPRLTATFRGGAQFRHYDDAVGFDADRTSPYFEGTLTYKLGKETSISWLARYSLEEPDVLTNPSREAFRTGLDARHNFTARVSGSLGIYYEHSNYHSLNTPFVFVPGFDEDTFDVALSVRYAITPMFGVEAGYNHTEIFSDFGFREYSRNRYWGGLNFRF